MRKEKSSSQPVVSWSLSNTFKLLQQLWRNGLAPKPLNQFVIINHSFHLTKLFVPVQFHSTVNGVIIASGSVVSGVSVVFSSGFLGSITFAIITVTKSNGLKNAVCCCSAKRSCCGCKLL